MQTNIRGLKKSCNGKTVEPIKWSSENSIWKKAGNIFWLFSNRSGYDSFHYHSSLN